MKRTQKALLAMHKENLTFSTPGTSHEENAEISPATGTVQSAEGSNVLMGTNKNTEALKNGISYEIKGITAPCAFRIKKKCPSSQVT